MKRNGNIKLDKMQRRKIELGGKPNTGVSDLISIT